VKTLKNLLYYVVVFFLVIYVLILALNPSKMIDIVGFRTFMVLSNSMEPKINVNDMIIITKASEDSLVVGDIITFEVYIPELNADDYVTHYIAAINDVDGVLTYETRRHSAPENLFDDWVDENGDEIDITFDNIEGKYLFKIPYVGYFQSALSNKIILALVVVNGGVVYLLIQYLKKDEEEEYEETDMY